MAARESTPITLLAGLILVGASCDPDAGPRLPATLEIFPAEGTLNAAGDTLRFTATVTDETGERLTDVAVDWSTPDPAHLVVEPTGLVRTLPDPPDRPLAVVATAEFVSDTAWLVSRQIPASVTIDGTDLELPFGFGADLEAVVRDSNDTAAAVPVTWRSTAPGLVSVDSVGRVLAAGVGTARVIATAGAVADSIQVSVSALEFAAIDAGYVHHACALTIGGRAYCWGYNRWGELGNGQAGAHHSVPVPVATEVRFVEIIAGNRHSCALTEESEVWCWGVASLTGGISTNDDCGGIDCTTIPARVDGIPPIVSLHGTRGTCGLTADGAAYCFRSEPEHLFPDLEVVGLASTESVYYALTAAGEVWIYNHYSREIEHVLTNPSFVSLTGGYGHLCALADNGSGLCWDRNDTGQLGTGDTEDRQEPTLVAGDIRFGSIHAGGWIEDWVDRGILRGLTCGVATDGSGYCWGDNYYGQVGNGNRGSECESKMNWDFETVMWPCEPAPSSVTGVLSFEVISPGGRFACGLSSAGLAYCWGIHGSHLGIGDAGLTLPGCGEYEATCAFTPLPVYGQRTR